MKINVVVGQSGGPTSVINSSLAGVYEKAMEIGADKIYGMIHGIEGFLDEKIVDLKEKLTLKDDVELLKRTPSAYLGSCRYKMPSIKDDASVYERVFEVMEKYNISYMFYIGGNDSMDTVKNLSDYAKMHGKSQKFIGVPKTIDNDLPITDHCPGYGSVAKYIATSVKEVMRDNESFGAKKPTVCIIETMGRNAGWITAAAALAKGEDCAGVDAIYIPERPFDPEEFVLRIKELAKTKSSIVIAVTEGIKLKDGRFVSDLVVEDAYVDAFGHKQNTGVAFYMAKLVAKETNLKTRTVEISSMQRAASHMASLTDIQEAYMAGYDAVNAAHDGKTGMMTILKVESRNPYKCTTDLYDIHNIANVEKLIPDEWITADGIGLTNDYIEYARPLIMGELTPIFENGIPKHLVLT